MLVHELATIRGQLHAVQTTLDGIVRLLTTLALDDISDLENDMMTVRRQAMPQGYFAETAWDILIQLDHARRHSNELVFPREDVGNMVSEATQRRFLSALEADGLVASEPAPDQPGRLLARLTEFGSASLSRIFSDAADLHALNISSLEGR
jgi:DNA-binding HxlR family transcriptional regulator